MKKNKYICPSLHVFTMMTEGIMQEISGTHVDTPPSSDTQNPSDGPEAGGGGGEEELSKKYNFNSWSSWD